MGVAIRDAARLEGTAAGAPTAAPAPKRPRRATVFGRSYDLRGPSIRDPRLHNSMGLFVVHVCGQLQFKWELSIAQILICWFTCGLIEVGMVMRRQRLIAWPGGALLTGNGIALLLRANGTQHGDWWSLTGWYYFFGAAVLAMVGKYVITYRGRHIFNPSNVILVAAFFVLGTNLVEPQPFWFGPLSVGLVATYTSLLVVGTLVTRRLGLFGLAAGFWLTFTVGLGVLALTGHAISARWHLGPVQGMTFWWVIVMSPEVFIFAFFMITDPRTVPVGRVGRLLFGMGVGVTSVVLMAPQTTEFNAKLAFLAGLAVSTAAWPLLVHHVPAKGDPDDVPLVWFRNLFRGTRERPLRAATTGLRAGGMAASLSVVVLAVVLLGIPGRPSTADAPVATGRPTVDVGRVPPVEISSEVQGVQASMSQADATKIATDVLADLQIEAQAVQRGDRALAATAATGDRLAAVRAQIDGGPRVTVGRVVLARSTLGLQRDSLQAIPRLALKIEGRVAGSPYEARVTLTLVGEHYLIAAVDD